LIYNNVVKPIIQAITEELEQVEVFWRSPPHIAEYMEKQRTKKGLTIRAYNLTVFDNLRNTGFYIEEPIDRTQIQNIRSYLDYREKQNGK